MIWEIFCEEQGIARAAVPLFAATDGRVEVQRIGTDCEITDPVGHPVMMAEAGFLECGECGGSFHAVSGRWWGCSWHRNRGTCENSARIAQEHLERSVLRAIKAALVEKVAEHALESASRCQSSCGCLEIRRFRCDRSGVRRLGLVRPNSPQQSPPSWYQGGRATELTRVLRRATGAA